MSLRVVDGQVVQACLPMGDCVDLMEVTQIALSAGAIKLPLRTRVDLAASSRSMYIMPGAMDAAFGAKLISLFPTNRGRGIPTIQGGILLFDPHSGAPTALVDAASVTAIRTAAASGAATRCLAREDAASLALLGYGVQAQQHLDAMALVRPIEDVRVWGPSHAKAMAFAERQRARTGLAVAAAETLTDAVKEADIICTVTSSTEPILFGAQVSKGCHINCIGAHSPSSREVDSELVRAARVFLEVRDFAMEEAGDILIPLREGTIEETHLLAEIGECLSGEKDGRTAPTDITLYKSLGNIAQDLAAANLVYQRSIERGLGTVVDF